MRRNRNPEVFKSSSEPTISTQLGAHGWKPGHSSSYLQTNSTETPQAKIQKLAVALEFALPILAFLSAMENCEVWDNLTAHGEFPGCGGGDTPIESPVPHPSGGDICTPEVASIRLRQVQPLA